MKKFIDTDPITLTADSRIVFKYAEFIPHKNENDYYFWLIDDNYLIWATRSFYIYKKDSGDVINRWVGGTKLEIPKDGLFWFVRVIEEQFLKTEAEGGLEKGRFGYEEEIHGEKLIVSRMFGTPGYSFRNHSRNSYLFDDSTDPQEFAFTDEMLFDHGLFEEFK